MLQTRSLIGGDAPMLPALSEKRAGEGGFSGIHVTEWVSKYPTISARPNVQVEHATLAAYATPEEPEAGKQHAGFITLARCMRAPPPATERQLPPHVPLVTATCVTYLHSVKAGHCLARKRSRFSCQAAGLYSLTVQVFV